jgi:hypothetical protein
MRTSCRSLYSEGHLRIKQWDSCHLSMAAGCVIAMTSARTVPAVSHPSMARARIAFLPQNDTDQKHPRWPLP